VTPTVPGVGREHTAAVTTASSPPAPFEFARIRWIYFGLLIGMFASSISMTIVGPAIPRIVAELGGVQYYAWLSTIVMLVSAVVTPISGKFSDMFGRRRFYILGLVVFMVGSALSGLAMNFPWLVAARAIQGAGMGVLMPLSQTILGDIIPPRQRGKYQGYMGAVMGASQVLGPLIGGWLTDAVSWRLLFYVNLPIGLAALYMIIRHLHVPELGIPATVDRAGIATMTVGVTATLLGISLGGTEGWLRPEVLALLAVGIVFLTVFVFVELRAAEPIVPMHLFRNSIFTWSTIAGFALNMGFMALIIYTPVYAQGVLGMSATESGLVLIPMNVAVFGMGIVVGNLTTRTGRYKEFAVAGIGIMLGAATLMLRLDVASTLPELTAYTLLFGLGLGMSFQVYTLAVQNAVRRRDLGVATSSLQFFRNIGNTLGTAVAGTLMTSSLLAGIQSRMTPELLAEVPGGRVDPNAVLSPSALAQLPDAVAQVLRLSLADAMHAVFFVPPIFSAVALAATLFIRPLPLRDTLATNEDRGREALDTLVMSNPEDDRALVSAADAHVRSKERMMGAHLILLAEQASLGNPILRDAVGEFGGGDVDRGLQMLRSAGTMLLSEDPAVIDEHEPFAVELSHHGKRRHMLSDELTRRLDAVAAKVASVEPTHPTKPRIESSDGIDGEGLSRAIGMLNAALVADIADRRWGVGDLVPTES